MFVFQFIVVLLLSHQQWCLWFIKINWKEKVSVFADLFKSDFPCPKALDAELDSWETYWLKSKDWLPGNIWSTLKGIQFNGFDIISVSVGTLGTSKVTICTYERLFPAMRLLKTCARSTMVLEWLNDVAIMHVYQEIDPDIEKAVDLFYTKNRRLTFT